MTVPKELVIEVFSLHFRWLEEPISSEKPKKLDARDEAVLRFANSLLKRTLSESFVGVPFSEDGLSEEKGSEGTTIRSNGSHKEKLVLNVRSLSLELAKHKHKLAAQLVSVPIGIESFSTGD